MEKTQNLHLSREDEGVLGSFIQRVTGHPASAGLLDVGCSARGFLQAALDAGLDAYGRQAQYLASAPVRRPERLKLYDDGLLPFQSRHHKGTTVRESSMTDAGNLISCSAKELREVRDYVRKLEADQHSLRVRNGHLNQARSLRLARALGDLRHKPATALLQVVRILFEKSSAKHLNQPALKHRSFAVLERRALPEVAAIAGAAHVTVLAEIAERTAPRLFVSLRGAGPTTRPIPDAQWCAVGPHDYEVLLATATSPILLIDPLGIPASSAWYGVFEVQDMRLNLAMAGLIETVRDRGGRVVCVRTEGTSVPPLLMEDFTRTAEMVNDFEPVFRQAHEQ
jgi:hypothetical protein